MMSGYPPNEMPTDFSHSKLHHSTSTNLWQIVCGWTKVFWTFPNSLIGLLIGIFGILFGGKAARYGKVLEFWGKPIGLVLRMFPPVRGANAITFGHVILYRSAEAREAFRAHEPVHVEQYEKWGILFIPAYLASSIVAFLRGQHPYFGNRFEQEAFARSSSSPSGGGGSRHLPMEGHLAKK